MCLREQTVKILDRGLPRIQEGEHLQHVLVIGPLDATEALELHSTHATLGFDVGRDDVLLPGFHIRQRPKRL